MNRKNTSNYQRLTKVIEFGKRNVSLFPNDSAAQETLEALDSSVRSFPEKMAARIVAERAMQASLKARSAARDILQRYITQADRIAGSIHGASIRKPVNGSEQALIDSGRGFLKDLGSASDVFAKHGLDVGAAVDALEIAIREYAHAKAERSAATKACHKAIEQAMAILPRFDALVENYLDGNIEATAAYAIARGGRELKAHRKTGQDSGTAPADPLPSPIPAPAA